MDEKRISIREWIRRFDGGAFEAADVRTQCDAGWFDWFCKDGALAGKTRRLGAKVKQLASSAKVDQDSMYVFFKNNCPMSGTLYDSFSFCDIKTGDVRFWITPCSGHTGNAEVVQSPNFATTAAEGSWSDVLDFFFPTRKALRDERVQKRIQRELAQQSEQDDARDAARCMV